MENHHRYKLCCLPGYGLVMLLIVCAALVVRTFAQQQAPAAGATVIQAGPILLIQTNLDCTFALDGGASQTLKAKDIKRLPIPLGEHLVTALSLDGKDQWEMVVNADKPLQKVVLIDLKKMRTDREN